MLPSNPGSKPLMDDSVCTAACPPHKSRIATQAVHAESRSLENFYVKPADFWYEVQLISAVDGSNSFSFGCANGSDKGGFLLHIFLLSERDDSLGATLAGWPDLLATS